MKNSRNDRFHQSSVRQIEDNGRLFSILERRITQKGAVEEVIALSEFAAVFALYRHTGMLSSCTIEKALINAAETLGADCGYESHRESSFLHVMTACYESGGHTSAVYNFIENCPRTQIHSVLLTDQGVSAIPDWLEDSVQNKAGDFIILDQGDAAEKALALRKTAASYEFIFLHVHTYDVIPLLAFGTPRFTRPVIFFNHADHLFWLGVSISDTVANLRTFGDRLCLTRRGVTKTQFLPIPLWCEHEPPSKEESRKHLGLPAANQLIVSIGSSFKYRSFGKYNFIETALRILEMNRDALLLVAGPGESETMWELARQKSCNRLKFIGQIGRDKVKHLLIAADLCIDSFPFPSPTAMLEAGLMDTPVLLSRTEFSQSDVFVEDLVPLNDVPKKATEILSSGQFKSYKESISKHHCGKNWLHHLNKLLSSITFTHSVKDRFPVGYELSELDEFLLNLNKNSYSNYSLLLKRFSGLSFQNRLFIFSQLLRLRIDFEPLTYLKLFTLIFVPRKFMGVMIDIRRKYLKNR